MENTEVIKALRCGGHNMIFHYCDKEDCPYCQYSYSDNRYRCNVQELGIDAAAALEAANEKIADCIAAIDALDDSNDAYIKANKLLKKQIAEQQKQIAQLYILLNNRINEIAELEADKKTLINVVKNKSDFHATKDAMRIAELEAQMPKEGEWETTDNRWGCGKYRCTVCNSYENDKRNYCPNCGARMKESKRITNIRGNYQQPLQSATINTASQSATINVGTTFLCRSTGKLCPNATQYGYCKQTVCNNPAARR
jgi:hypothetical protein